MSLLGKKVDVWFINESVLRGATVLHIPSEIGDSWHLLDKDGLEHAVQSFQSIDECAPQKESGAVDNSIQQTK